MRRECLKVSRKCKIYAEFSFQIFIDGETKKDSNYLKINFKRFKGNCIISGSSVMDWDQDLVT